MSVDVGTVQTFILFLIEVRCRTYAPDRVNMLLGAATESRTRLCKAGWLAPRCLIGPLVVVASRVSCKLFPFFDPFGPSKFKLRIFVFRINSVKQLPCEFVAVTEGGIRTRVRLCMPHGPPDVARKTTQHLGGRATLGHKRDTYRGGDDDARAASEAAPAGCRPQGHPQPTVPAAGDDSRA